MINALNMITGDEDAIPTLSISPTSYTGDDEVSYLGATLEITVDVTNSSQAWACAVSYVVTPMTSWIVPASTSGTGDTLLSVVVSPQPEWELTDRIGYITFTSNYCNPVIVTIHQDQYPAT